MLAVTVGVSDSLAAAGPRAPDAVDAARVQGNRANHPIRFASLVLFIARYRVQIGHIVGEEDEVSIKDVVHMIAEAAEFKGSIIVSPYLIHMYAYMRDRPADRPTDGLTAV